MHAPLFVNRLCVKLLKVVWIVKQVVWQSRIRVDYDASPIGLIHSFHCMWQQPRLRSNERIRNFATFNLPGLLLTQMPYFRYVNRFLAVLSIRNSTKLNDPYKHGFWEHISCSYAPRKFLCYSFQVFLVLKSPLLTSQSTAIRVSKITSHLWGPHYHESRYQECYSERLQVSPYIRRSSLFILIPC